MFHLFFTFLAIVLTLKIDVSIYSSLTLAFGCALALWANRGHVNLVFLCTIILVSTLIEIAIFLYVPLEGGPSIWINNRIFLLHALIDFITLLLVMYRGSIFRWVYSRLHKPREHIYLINADVAMMLILFLFLMVDCSAAVENWLRHLDVLGFSKEIAQPLWDLNWIFYHYAYFKSALMGMQFLVLWSMLGERAKSKTQGLMSLNA